MNPSLSCLANHADERYVRFRSTDIDTSLRASILTGNRRRCYDRAMNLCRFSVKSEDTRIGLMADDSTLIDLTAAGVLQLSAVLEANDPVAQLDALQRDRLPRVKLTEARLRA